YRRGHRVWTTMTGWWSAAPFVVPDGNPEGDDLVAEWNIVDARWYELFAKAGLQKLFKVLM
ncbi:hypothetical protein ACCS75_35660, partial [Rhizobium ruizarguesonis]